MLIDSSAEYKDNLIALMYTFILLHVAAFFLGAIPVGYLIGRLKGVDVRSEGSGNTGATNLARTLGKKAGLLTLIGDMFKGILSVLLAVIFEFRSPVVDPGATLGFFAILGHCFSPFLRFKGGKGVATSLGVFLILVPLETVLCVFLFLATVTLSRFVSLGSLVAVGCMPVILLLRGLDTTSSTLIVTSVLTALLIFSRHRANILRLCSGTENRFSLQGSVKGATTNGN